MKGIENPHYEGLDRVLDQGMESDQSLHPQRSSPPQLQQPDLNREIQSWTEQQPFGHRSTEEVHVLLL